MKLVYSEAAIRDLRRLRQFIAQSDPGAARRIGIELVQRMENLRQFPRMGRPVELAPDPASIRDVVFGSYIVRYSVHAESVIILRVWHHYEDREQTTRTYMDASP